MTKSLELHLERITKKNFKSWLRHHAFTVYASATNKDGLVELGADGLGTYAVRLKRSETHFYETANKAIKAYREFLTQHTD